MVYCIRSWIANRDDTELPPTSPAASAEAPGCADAEAATNASFLEAVTRLAEVGRIQEQQQLVAHDPTGGVAPAEPDGESDFGKRWERIPRSDADLAVLFLTGTYGARVFARHSVLNPADVVMRADQYRELATLVDRLLSASLPFRSKLRQIALKDRIAIVRGRPSEVAAIELDEAQQNSAVQDVVQIFKSRGEEVTSAEAKERMRRGEAFSFQMPTNSSFIDGKIYRNSSFGSLPVHNSSWFDQLRYVALEEAAIIVGWFKMYGFCEQTSDIDNVLRRIQTVSPTEVERLAR